MYMLSSFLLLDVLDLIFLFGERMPLRDVISPDPSCTYSVDARLKQRLDVNAYGTHVLKVGNRASCDPGQSNPERRYPAQREDGFPGVALY